MARSSTKSPGPPAKHPNARNSRDDEPRGLKSRAIDKLMPRHAPLYAGIVLGLVAFAISFFLVPASSVSIGANGLFIGFLALSFLKLPRLTSQYLRRHAREEDTPVAGIFLIILVVLIASVVSLVVALHGGANPDPWEVTLSVVSVILGWFTVQALGASHYAYEYYQAGDDGKGSDVEGGLDFQGDEDPDGFDFMYFSFTVGTSVATSDTKVESGKMRRMVLIHLVFSHLFNTIILASAVNVMLSVGGG